MAVMQSVTAEERERGVREIDLHNLRKPGTGVYPFEELIERHHNLDGGII